jgi:hypothetical protein
MQTTINPNQPTLFTPQIRQAARWLVQSGVQIAGDNPAHEGGFVCWYEQDTHTMPFVYSEITGMLTTMMCSLYQQSHDVQYLNCAIRAGDWLVRTAHSPTGGFRCLYPLRPSRFDYKASRIYAFDCGVILNGLVELYRATRNPKFLAASLNVGDWLVREAQKSNGAFRSVYDIEKNAFIESDQEWSQCSGSYHTKIAGGLANLYDVTRREAYLRAAIRSGEYALGFQQPDGRFVSFPSGVGTHSHPHAYSAEGLWVLGRYLKREDFLLASAQAASWLLRWQAPDGVSPRYVYSDVPVYAERVDVLAQTLRLAAIHLGENRLPGGLRSKLPGLVAAMTRHQVESEDPRLNGAFYFGQSSRGEFLPHANVWVTAFAAQGLRLFEQLSQGAIELHPFSLA